MTTTTVRRPLVALKVKELPAPRLPSPEKTKKTKGKTGREVNSLEKRLINIRLHLLQNTTRRAQPPAEPTLVFDSFLYLGGLKSLSNKVSFILLLSKFVHTADEQRLFSSIMSVRKGKFHLEIGQRSFLKRKNR